MKKEEMIKARAAGLKILRAQANGKAFRIVFSTEKGGWKVLEHQINKPFETREECENKIKYLVSTYPEQYIED